MGFCSKTFFCCLPYFSRHDIATCEINLVNMDLFVSETDIAVFLFLCLPDDSTLPLMQSALLTVARQEVDRFNRLLQTILASLRSITRALAGEIVMTDSLEQTFNAILLQKVLPSLLRWLCDFFVKQRAIA